MRLWDPETEGTWDCGTPGLWDLGIYSFMSHSKNCSESHLKRGGHLDYNVSSGPFLCLDFGVGLGPELDNIVHSLIQSSIGTKCKEHLKATN